jgi:hypothetical protein
MEKHEVEKATKEHIRQVGLLINKVITLLQEKTASHDSSKLLPPEVEIFEEYTPKLRDLSYWSQEYTDILKEMKPALDHHYKVNRHHPEHFDEGMKGMNLIDLIEMFCDWTAATKRHADGNIIRSIEQNKDRFGYGDMIESIFKNTVKILEEENDKKI